MLGLIDADEIQYQALDKRRISEETARLWRYGVSTYHNRPVHVAEYRTPDGTKIVAQKIRTPDKQFVVLGDMKEAGLFGQHLWRDGGRMVVVTEGEIDALSVAQLQGNKWPVVSVPNGAAGAKKAVAKAADWLEKFEVVVFMFDMDEPGQKAAQQCAELLTPGKAKIASLRSFKDPNEALVAGDGKSVIDAMWGAKIHRPDGIINGAETWDKIVAESEESSALPYPWEGLQKILHGGRLSEIVTFTAGSGIGKSEMVRQIAYHWAMTFEESIGYVALEESVRRTALGFMSLQAGKLLHVTQFSPADTDLKAAFDATLGTGRFYLYDHWGSTETDNLLAKIRYLVRGYGVRTVVLDHISIVVSGLEGGDERRIIDNLMTKLRTLVQELNFRLLIVTHLKRPEGRGHEEGGRVSLGHLRGSGSIAQLSDIVVGLERDQQTTNGEPSLTTVRVLKNRYTGETGVASHLQWDKETGRLVEVDPDFAAVSDDKEQNDF